MEETLRYPVVLSIAGSDSSGGAGIQADLKAISALGAYAATAITAITVQNTLGVTAIHPVPEEIVRGQIRAVADDLRPDAVKIGMVNDVRIIRAIAAELRQGVAPVVVYDPVMVSTSGSRLIEETAIEVIKEELFPLCSLITPNLHEAEVLTGSPVRTMAEMEACVHQLTQWGDYAVLLKGGHLEGKEMKDLLLLPGETTPLAYSAPRVETKNTHGTGCSLSSAIAALLARRFSLPEAVEQAKRYVNEAIRQGAEVSIGHGHGPMNHFFAPLAMEKR